MANPTTSQLFDGKVVQREYSSALGVEIISAQRTYYVSLTVEQVFSFAGLNETQANSTESVTVTDVGGTVYTVPFKQSFTDGSTGYAICPQEQVEVQRERMSPRLWRVTVTRRGSKLVRIYPNGSKTTLFDAPTWAASYV